MSYNEDIRDANQSNNSELFIIKRNGQRVPFDRHKIEVALQKSNSDVANPWDKLTNDQIEIIAHYIEKDAAGAGRDYTVEEIQDKVINHIQNSGKFELAKKYIVYRYEHAQRRKRTTLDNRINAIVEGVSDDAKTENSNKNPDVMSVQRDYIAGEFSRYFTEKYLMDEDLMKAHKDGLIHFHDSDYFIQKEHNCCLVNLDDMLQNGTRLSGVPIYKPHSFATACTLASQIISQVASAQYGGQTITLTHLAPFVDISRQKIRKNLRQQFIDSGIETDNEKLNKMAEEMLMKEIKDGCQTIQYQLITLQTTNGQAPFVTVFMYLHEAPEGQERDDLALIIKTMLIQREQGINTGNGVFLTPAFPKLIYVLQEDNVYLDSKYFYLTELAARCTARRMVPDYISEKKMQELKGDVYPCMGCRSFLTPDRFTDAGIGNIANTMNYKEGQHKYYGRFNQGVVTINLVDVACSSYGNEDKFWELMNERLELCHRALRLRHERLLGTPSDVAPIQWQDGALARLKPGETIDKLLFDGYSTISLGYAGLAECTYRMKGCSHTTEAGKEFAMKVMQALNDACQKWKKAENIDYSVYGTPLESTTYKFAKCLQKRFGIIPHVTDKNYITNSYHVHVTEPIDAFDKLTKEAEFQKLSPGGAISYVEIPNMNDNIPGVLAILQHIYNTILYAELNSKSDYCENCGFDGEIQIKKDGSTYVWECPQCGCRDQHKLHVARRTCGYIGTQFWNQGRTQEIAERVLHVSLPTNKIDTGSAE